MAKVQLIRPRRATPAPMTDPPTVGMVAPQVRAVPTEGPVPPPVDLRDLRPTGNRLYCHGCRKYHYELFPDEAGRPRCNACVGIRVERGPRAKPVNRVTAYRPGS